MRRVWLNLNQVMALPLNRRERGPAPTLVVLNGSARALGVTLAEFFGPLDQPYRVRRRKARAASRAGR